MGKWVHRLSGIDPDALTGECAECGPSVRLIAIKGNRFRCWSARQAEKEKDHARSHKGPGPRKPPSEEAKTRRRTQQATPEGKAAAAAARAKYLEKGGRRAIKGKVTEEAKLRARLRKYGMTLEDFEALQLAHGGKCGVCEKSRKLVIDYCHDTGRVRGLVCNHCNRGMGLLGDQANALEAALDYLRRAA